MKNTDNVKSLFTFNSFTEADRVPQYAKPEVKTVVKTEKTKTGAALCAAAIRTELKAVFPLCKFQVTSENFSMGNAVNIEWLDGPTDAEVCVITDKYQYGHFDGMEDMYVYSNKNANVPQAKYVHTRRRMTDGLIEAEMAKHNWSDRVSEREQRERAIDVVRKTSLYPTTEVKAIEVPAIKVESSVSEIEIVDYSEKAIAVFGEGTKAIKDQLIQLGGKANWHLKYKDGKKFGFIFSKKRAAELKTLLNA